MDLDTGLGPQVSRGWLSDGWDGSGEALRVPTGPYFCAKIETHLACRWAEEARVLQEGQYVPALPVSLPSQ